MESMPDDQKTALQGLMSDLMVRHLKPLYSGSVEVYFGPVTDNGKTFKVYLQLDRGVNFMQLKKSVDNVKDTIYTIEADISYFGRDDIPKGQIHFFIKLK